MSRKNPVLSIILGFFVIGLFYAGGLKKGGIAFIVLSALSYGLMMAAGPTVALICNFVGAYLGHKWAKEHNDALADE